MIAIEFGAGLFAGMFLGFACGYTTGRTSSKEDDATIAELRDKVSTFYCDAEIARKTLGLLRKDYEILEALRDSLQEQIAQSEADARIKLENAKHKASEASKRGWARRKADMGTFYPEAAL